MGLNICTRWRAISARRSRRISSSLLPLNIGPQITSIQPRLPRIAFIFSPLSLLLQTADAPCPTPSLLLLSHAVRHASRARCYIDKPAGVVLASGLLLSAGV